MIKIITSFTGFEYIVFDSDGNEIAESCNEYRTMDEAVDGARDLIKLIKNPNLEIQIKAL